MENQDIEVTLTFTVTEVNQILAALQPLPFKDVVHIVNKIHTQGSPQIAAAQKGKTVDAEVINADDTE
jgi:hypothetical protein